MTPFAKAGYVPALAFEKTNAFSVSVWTKVTVANNAATGNGGSIIGNINNDNNAVGWDLYNTAVFNGDTSFGFQPRVSFADTNAATVIGVETQTIFTDGNWHHTVFTYNGANSGTPTNDIKIYVDGVLNSTQSVHGNSIVGNMTSLFPFTLGTRNNGVDGSGNVHHFNGNIDMASVWNRVLNQAEVSQLYNAGSGVDVAGLSFYSDNIVWYPIGEGADTTSNIIDLKNGYNATGSGVTFQPGAH